MIISFEALDKILKRGTYYAAKWAGHKNEREMWEHRYFAVQGVYSDMIESATAYADFNWWCGVTVENGHITDADGLKCGVQLESYRTV